MIVHISSEPYEPEPAERPTPGEYAETPRKVHEGVLPYGAEDFIEHGHGGPITPGIDRPF